MSFESHFYFSNPSGTVHTCLETIPIPFLNGCVTNAKHQASDKA